MKLILNTLHRIPLLSWLLPLLLAIIFLSLSFVEITSHTNRIKRLVQVEKTLRNKQSTLEAIALEALNSPANAWLSSKKVEKDMVVYKYVNDSLISWVNTFPIINDNYSSRLLVPPLTFFSRNKMLQQPLSDANETEQYLNLGSGWYVVRVYTEKNVTLVTGVLIQTDYPISNTFINSSVNPALNLPSYCSIVPLNLDEGFVIFGKENMPLFTILSNVSLQHYSQSVLFRWLALFFAFTALFVFYLHNKSLLSAFFMLSGIIFIRFICFAFASSLQMDTPFFSPLLFAGGTLENSLAALLLNTFLIFVASWSVYYVRDEWGLFWRSRSHTFKMITKIIHCLFVIGLVYLIAHTLKSLTNNSSIVLELYKLDEISWYTIIAFTATGFLFLALFQLIRTLLTMRNIPETSFLMQNKFLLAYVAGAALLSMVIVSIYGQIKEYRRDQVWTQKMAVERDLELEMQLRRSEKMIAADPILSIMIQMEQDSDIILSRLRETYFSDFLQRYNIQITICAPGDVLMVDGIPNPVPCYNFFHSELLRNGTPLSDQSNFYYRDNKLGNTSYVGVFTYYNYGGSLDLYIEMDAQYVKDVLGYPSLLSDKSQLDRFKLPYDYSYAKYIDGKLVSNSGAFSYPSIVTIELEEGFSHKKLDGQMSYFLKTGNKVLVISRPTRSPFPYLVSASYLALFYGMIFALCLGVFRRREIRLDLPKNSLRRKITWLLVGTLVFALICMATGSIGFGLKIYDESNTLHMRTQMQTAQSSLEDFVRKSNRFRNPLENTAELANTLSRLSENSQVQVLLFDPSGRILRSTQPELIEQHLMSARMNGNAFKELHALGKTQFTQKETIGTLSYLSMYAPLYDTTGKLIAFINVPYLSGQTDVTKDTSSIVAAVINLYLLLLLAALFMSFTLSNQITRPLALLSAKMNDMDVTRKAEHINYNSEDELGMLVKAYNKMADDLDESTRRLAQTEREQAWREMARQIAHEIKNPLTPMRLSIQYLMRMKAEGSPKWINRFDSVANSILEQIDILAQAASEFSNFSRFYMEDPSLVELNALIKEQVVLFNTSDHIKIIFSSLIEEANVNGRRTQLARLLVNLLSNAVQAVENISIGIITVSLEADEQKQDFLLKVADNGPGVAVENRDKLFKPNFTTKSSGTGLGLAICRGILEQSQGDISYSESEWGGACFIVRLPQASQRNSGLA